LIVNKLTTIFCIYISKEKSCYQ